MTAPGHASPSHYRRALFALFLYTLVVFGGTVAMRRPWYGRMSLERHYWLTAVTIRFVDRWYEEGAWKLGFAMIDDPPSIEFPSVASRSPYVSYGPGALLPVYALARLQGHPPTPRMVMGWNLVNHFALAFLLACIALLAAWVARLRAWQGVLLGACAASIELLTPGTLYYLQNVYFTDQAVLVPFALAVLLELLVDVGLLAGRRGRVLQAVVIAFGIFTDWLMVFVAGAIFLKRLARRQIAWKPRALILATLRFSVPVVVPLALFAAQVAWLGWFGALYGRFLWRTASHSGPAGSGLWERFWEGHLVQLYGTIGAVAIGLALLGSFAAVAWTWRRSRREPATPTLSFFASALFLLAAPALAQVLVFQQHSSVHEFSGLKFSLLLSVGPLVLLPLWGRAAIAVRQQEDPAREGSRLLWALPVVLGAIYLALVAPGYQAMYPPMQVAWADLARDVRAHVGYREVVLSPSFAIDLTPPQLLTLSDKRVYRTEDASAALALLEKVPAKAYDVDLLYPSGMPCAPLPQLASEAKERVTTAHFTLLRFGNAELASALKTLARAPLCLH